MTADDYNKVQAVLAKRNGFAADGEEEAIEEHPFYDDRIRSILFQGQRIKPVFTQENFMNIPLKPKLYTGLTLQKKA